MARPEITGRGPPDACSIASFCKQHGISRAQYYVLRKAGLGPDEMRLIGRVLITREAAARWRRKHTARSGIAEVDPAA
jgi:hypothetical protein